MKIEYQISRTDLRKGNFKQVQCLKSNEGSQGLNYESLVRLLCEFLKRKADDYLDG